MKISTLFLKDVFSYINRNKNYIYIKMAYLSSPKQTAGNGFFYILLTFLTRLIFCNTYISQKIITLNLRYLFRVQSGFQRKRKCYAHRLVLLAIAIWKSAIENFIQSNSIVSSYKGISKFVHFKTTDLILVK
jgi:hypothetical protein